MNTTRKIWQHPWQYKESIAIVIGLMLTGGILQFTVGEFNFFLLQMPVNLIIGAALILLLILFALFGKGPLFRWFSGVPFAVSLMGGLLLLTLIMGLTPQVKHTHATDFFTRLGARNVTSSWPFVLVYLTTILALGALIIRRLMSFRKRDTGFYAIHIGLWLVLFASAFGAADMRRYVMHVREGEVEWRVYSETDEMLELPIAIQLNDFDMEEYPPKLTMINRESGEPQPSARPDYYQIDEKQPKGTLNGWDVELTEYIHHAVRSSDSTYREVPMPGATPAAKIRAKHRASGEEREGWVCGGNMAQLYMTLAIDSQTCIVMTQPEPKSFLSDINVFLEKGADTHAILEVNKPLRIGNWAIYQYGYDNQAGRMSTYSSLELVYDPWVYPVYVGFILIAIGAICLVWIGNSKKRKKENDVE